jgi:hypothetical protein
MEVFMPDQGARSATRPTISAEAIMRPRWADLELGLGAEVWADARPTFGSQVVEPHFEAVCREFARAEGRRIFRAPLGELASGTVADPENKTQIEIDVAVLGPARPEAPRQVIYRPARPRRSR